jgi:hypothetical protein
MYLVVIGWMYVAVMMSLAEAFGANGSVLGAIVTFFVYGLCPLALVVYLMGTPARKRAIKAREAAEATSGPAPSSPPDAGGHAPGAAQDGGVAPVGEKPPGV